MPQQSQQAGIASTAAAAATTQSATAQATAGSTAATTAATKRRAADNAQLCHHAKSVIVTKISKTILYVCMFLVVD